MILLTLTAVVLTGFTSTYFLLQPPRSLIGQAKIEAAASSPRDPASVIAPIEHPIGFGTTAPRAIPKAVDLDLACDTSKLVYDNSVAQIRLTGAPCSDAKAVFVSSEIRNEANGFSATVFHPTGSTFTTDYISLSPGLNHIRVLHQFVKGAREEREYIIERGKF